MDTIRLETGEGRLHVLLHVWNTGSGVSVCITGGDLPHVGGVVLCTPRASLQDGGASCDEYVLPVPGHKDHEAAKIVAHDLCCTLGVPVSVTCGIHSDQMTADEIRQVLSHVKELSRQLVEMHAVKEESRL